MTTPLGTSSFKANGEDSLITLTDVAKLTPGRPSANCVWRWCRKGLKSRNGERIRLQHVRFGGQIYTTAAWLNEFGCKLADADTRHFKSCEATMSIGARREKCRARSTSQIEQRKRFEEAERALEEAGI